ncbi:MAG: hypothetical protein GHCLOJNM_01542 [bacterium]|nr:hypothetical protein [bacterium]
MPVVFLNRKTQPQFVARISALRADSAPKWGSLSATKLMRHLTRSIEMSLGEVEVEDRSNWFSRHMVKRLVFHWFTRWPKGLKAPEIFTPEPSESFERERELLLDAIERFLVAAEKEPTRTGISPFLGPQPLEYWRRIHGVHFSHHMRQFGV